MIWDKEEGKPKLTFRRIARKWYRQLHVVASCRLVGFLRFTVYTMRETWGKHEIEKTDDRKNVVSLFRIATENGVGWKVASSSSLHNNRAVKRVRRIDPLVFSTFLATWRVRGIIARPTFPRARTSRRLSTATTSGPPCGGNLAHSPRRVDVATAQYSNNPTAGLMIITPRRRGSSVWFIAVGWRPGRVRKTKSMTVRALSLT